MSSFIRAALHGNNSTDTTIIMDGPLSEQFTKALNLAYAKRDPVTDEPMVGEGGGINSEGMDKKIRAISQESQQLDEDDQAGAIAVNKALGGKQANELRVYGVNANEVQNDDIVRFARLASTVRVPSDLVLIAAAMKEHQAEFDNDHINNTLNATDPVKESSAKTNALHLIADSFRVKSYTSLDAFQKDFFD